MSNGCILIYTYLLINKDLPTNNNSSRAIDRHGVNVQIFILLLC